MAYPPMADEEFLQYLTLTIRVRDENEPPDFTQLFLPATLARLAHIRRDHPAAYYGAFLPELRLYRELWVPDLERAIAAATDPAASALPPRQAYTPPTLCPPLPAFALCTHPDTEAAPWLEAYIAHSRQWSPRGIASAHQAVGLWVLSTIAARRVYCAVGATHVYPVLFLAMVARSTLYAKSTTARLGREVIQRAGCAGLLTADRTTPQALLRAMSGAVPPGYGTSPADIQAQIRQRLAFAGQRGAYFEEWGGMLAQMRRTDSPMAEFHTLLRVLDDGQATYTNDTIQRGLEEIHHPYLALLASATPHDLAPFMAPGSAWWHDGFWPRFAMICPAADEEPVLTQRPRTDYHIPGALLEPLHSWHMRLGLPTVTIEPLLDARGKPTGGWQALRSPLPQQEIGLSPAVHDAYEAYNQGLLTLLHQGDIPQDYDATYGRFHDKALRIALVLAAFAGERTIGLHHWAYAQRTVERWRHHVHTLVAQVASAHPLTPEEQAEQKILAYLERVGHATGRELQQYCHLGASSVVTKLLDTMVPLGHLIAQKDGRKTLYGLLPKEDGPATHT